MKFFYRYLLSALAGGFGYCTLEIIWRGRTHYSMFFAGAIVLTLFYFISQNINISFWKKCFFGMIIISVIEFVFGVVFNIILREHVWDYSNLPLNLFGQICLPFCVLWFILSAVIFKILEIFSNKKTVSLE